MDKKWDPKTKIQNTFFYSFSLCVLNLVSKIFKRPLYKRKNVFLEIGQKKVFLKSRFIADFRSEGIFQKKRTGKKLEPK
jgi:hypothetical protein